MSGTREPDWHTVAVQNDLPASGRKVVKVEGKQIVLFRTGPETILACNNRCPHEGYPLSEGHLSGPKSCILTCNWHNWKFDLESGETLVGGDRLRRYPVRLEGDAIQIDICDPPAEEVIAASLAQLSGSFDRHEYDRIAREIARLIKAGGDPLEGLRQTIAQTADRFEFGTTHAVPASADWLSLRSEGADDPARGLASIVECIGHYAWDSRREPARPFPAGSAPWDEDAFVQAIENENEAGACALVRGAVADGLGWPDMERGFARAALAHYADFGHLAIYTYKMRALTGHLGDAESLEHLCLMLARSMTYAAREDLIPEFKAYRTALDAWDGAGSARPTPEDLRQGSVRSILAQLSAGSGDVKALYTEAYQAAAWQLLHFDLAWQDKTDGSISQNVGWLDFTHGLTFANATRNLCEAHPDLWPNALLQIGCFLGRNSGFTDPALETSDWQAADPAAQVEDALAGIKDHGQFEYIVSSHLLKLSYAIREEIRHRPADPGHGLAAAALHRFLESPLKRKHTLRTAQQALNFVAGEG